MKPFTPSWTESRRHRVTQRRWASPFDRLESRVLLTAIAMNSPPLNLSLGASAGSSAGRGVVSADFNGDGKADIAVLESTFNQANNQVGVLFGDGSNGFTLSANYSASGSNFCMDIVAGDFNGDGKIDIAVTGQTSSAGFVGIYYNLGNGTFGPRTNYLVNVPPVLTGNNVLLAVADFNGDGIRDIAVTGLTVVSVLTSQPGGGFARQDVSIGQTLLGIDAGDFNGDGRPDLAILNKAGLVLKTNNPDGSFSTAWSSPTFAIQRVICDDFNGDGISDLGMLTATGGTTYLTVQINQGSGTTWNSSSIALGTSQSYTYLVVADFNGDGRRDAAAIDNLTKLAVFLTNQGNGVFGDKITYSVGGFTSKGMVATDTNGDGRPELISINSGQTSFSLLTNATPGGMPQSVTGRHIFYNHSHFDLNNAGPGNADDLAIDLSKAPLLPGQAAAFANYTSYSRGINGIMIDLTGLPRGLSAADFVFKIGNDNAPEAWIDAPLPASVVERLGDATGSWTRVSIVWPDGAITGKWLQVTLKSNAASGLAADDVFYFGNAPGEAGGANDAKVNATDEIRARLGAAPSAGITHQLDFNRDGAVDGLDVLVAREHCTYYLNELKLIQAPGSAAAGVWLGAAAPLGTMGFLPASPPRLAVLPQSMPSLARPPLKQVPPLPQVVILKLVEAELPAVPGTSSPGFVVRTTGAIRATLVKLALMKRPK